MTSHLFQRFSFCCLSAINAAKPDTVIMKASLLSRDFKIIPSILSCLSSLHLFWEQCELCKWGFSEHFVRTEQSDFHKWDFYFHFIWPLFIQIKKRFENQFSLENMAGKTKDGVVGDRWKWNQWNLLFLSISIATFIVTVRKLSQNVISPVSRHCSSCLTTPIPLSTN